MTNALITLSDLFLSDQQGLREEETIQIEQADDTLAAKATLTKGQESVDWPSAWQQIRSQLPRLFDVQLLDIMFAGWEKYRLVTDYADPDSHPASERTTLDLGKRSLSSTHNPTVRLMVNERVKATLTFTIKLQLQFEVLKLTLGAGRIWRIETGQCKGAGSVLMKNHTILQRSFQKVDLPGHIDFPEGIPIPSAKHHYQWGEASSHIKEGN